GARPADVTDANDPRHLSRVRIHSIKIAAIAAGQIAPDLAAISLDIRAKSPRTVKQAAKRVRNRRSVNSRHAGMDHRSNPARGEHQMIDQAITTTIAPDARPLFVVSGCVTELLGMLLLFAWRHDRVTALAWWGAAYLVGAFAVGLWAFGASNSAVPASLPAAVLFIACGMTW